MRIGIHVNGTTKVELIAETPDDRLVLELIKDKTVSKISPVAGQGDSLSGVVFEMVKVEK